MGVVGGAEVAVISTGVAETVGEGCVAGLGCGVALQALLNSSAAHNIKISIWVRRYIVSQL